MLGETLLDAGACRLGDLARAQTVIAWRHAVGETREEGSTSFHESRSDDEVPLICLDGCEATLSKLDAVRAGAPLDIAQVVEAGSATIIGALRATMAAAGLARFRALTAARPSSWRGSTGACTAAAPPPGRGVRRCASARLGAASSTTWPSSRRPSPFS